MSHGQMFGTRAKKENREQAELARDITLLQLPLKRACRWEGGRVRKGASFQFLEDFRRSFSSSFLCCLSSAFSSSRPLKPSHSLASHSLLASSQAYHLSNKTFLIAFCVSRI